MILQAKLMRMLAGIMLFATVSLASADVVVVVSSKSRVSTLSASQLADIFLGKANRYPDGTIAIPVDRGEGSAIRDEFYEKYTGKNASMIKAHWSKLIFTGRGQPPRTAATSGQIKQILSDHPHSIAYMDSSETDATVKVLTIN